MLPLHYKGSSLSYTSQSYGWESNPQQPVYKTGTLPIELPQRYLILKDTTGTFLVRGLRAGEGTRTLDNLVGNEVLYQLSYTRNNTVRADGGNRTHDP